MLYPCRVNIAVLPPGVMTWAICLQTLHDYFKDERVYPLRECGFSVCRLEEFEEVDESSHGEDVAQVGVHALDVDMAAFWLGVLEHAEEEP